MLSDEYLHTSIALFLTPNLNSISNQHIIVVIVVDTVMTTSSAQPTSFRHFSEWKTKYPVIHAPLLLARDRIYAIARSLLSPVRLSVCPSHRWISQRRFKIGSRNLHHSVAP